MLFWSIAFIWVNQLFEFGFRPLTIAFLRLAVASVFLTLCTKLMQIKEKIKKKDYKFIFFLGFAEPFCYFLGAKYGMMHVTATTASILVSFIPLIVPFLAWYFLKERVTIYKAIGLIVSFAGVLLMVVEDLSLGGKLIGFFLMGIAILSGSAYTILLRKLTSSYSALTITKYQMYIGCCLFFPLFLIFDFQHFINMPLSLSHFNFILLLGALPSSLSFVFIAIAVRQLGAVKPSIMTNIIPVFTAILAFYILKEPFTTMKILAIFIVLIGLFVSQIPKKEFI
jgi:drug/metabolite transporter (DMT)-like permease